MSLTTNIGLAYYGLIVHIISAANVSGDRGITLLAIGIIAIFLLFLVTCRPYKKWPVELLEAACYANIAGLCLATLYISKIGKNHDTAGYISGTIYQKVQNARRLS